MKKGIYKYSEEWSLESGESLSGFELTYHTAGKLNEDQSNVIWVCHALTANSNVSDWWKGLFGKGNALDPEKFFIICVNVLGSCYGSTNPLSTNEITGKPYFHSFPDITIRDIVNSFDHLRISLGINKIHTLIGGSLGGQQVLEWAIKQPRLFKRIIPIATNAKHSPWGIAFNETQRMAISSDPTWINSHHKAGMNGMKTARAIALLSYRAYKTYDISQSEKDQDKVDQYQAASYQQYQGEKLARRFNAFSYWFLSKAMDSHHIGRSRESIKKALGEIEAASLIIGVNSDNLFPIKEQVFLFNHIPDAQLEVVDSEFGHDGFLTETLKINPLIKRFINSKIIKNQEKESLVAIS